jgi:SAM-dependent methyltransferase
VAVLTHIDLPQGGVIRGTTAVIHGWIASNEHPRFENLSLVNAGGIVVPLGVVDRPDVRAAKPGYASTGFAGWIDVRENGKGPWRLRYENGSGVPSEIPLSLRADDADVRGFSEAKARKLDRLRPLLRCPSCREILTDTERGFCCAAGHEFPARADAYDFLTDEIRQRSGIFRTENISGHGYDATLQELIASSAGPIIDVGAGLRPDYREDVINLEVVAYPTTDVIAASEYLPFADATFDLVISVAVLEHVRDPFAASRELARIVRPGGRIFAAVPFLQPYHGYPDHYYNMTAAGLRNLFDGFDVERLDVPASGHPVFALTWIVKSWLAGLSPQNANAFAQLKVGDLATDPLTLLDQPFASELSATVQLELAALNVLVGRKRE